MHPRYNILTSYLGETWVNTIRVIETQIQMRICFSAEALVQVEHIGSARKTTLIILHWQRTIAF